MCCSATAARPARCVDSPAFRSRRTTGGARKCSEKNGSRIGAPKGGVLDADEGAIGTQGVEDRGARVASSALWIRNDLLEAP